MENKKVEKEILNYEKSVKKKKSNINWIIKITLFAMIISFAFSYSSEIVVSELNVLLSIIFLMVIILLGVIFDMIGVACTTVSSSPFHSMSSKKVRGAKTAIKLISNAEKVSSFCNDVVGDICGILSGTICVLVSSKFSNYLNTDAYLTTLVLTAVVTGLTIGGKAIGKSLAINKNVYIIYKASRIISIFNKNK